jgi:hypothetical protein
VVIFSGFYSSLSTKHEKGRKKGTKKAGVYNPIKCLIAAVNHIGHSQECPEGDTISNLVVFIELCPSPAELSWKWGCAWGDGVGLF